MAGVTEVEFRQKVKLSDIAIKKIKRILKLRGFAFKGERSKLEYLELSPFIINILKKNNITSVELLVAKTESELLKIMKLGQNKVDQIKKKLVEQGLALKASPDIVNEVREKRSEIPKIKILDAIDRLLELNPSIRPTEKEIIAELIEDLGYEVKRSTLSQILFKNA